MSLLEMLGYVAVLAVLFNIAAGAFLMCSRLSAKGTTTLDRSWAVEEVRTEFTEAVRGASRIVPSVCTYQTGPHQLVLEMPPEPDEPEAKRYTVLGLLGKEARMSRIRLVKRAGEYVLEEPDEGQPPSASEGFEASAALDGFDTYRLPIETLAFTYDAAEPADSRLVTVAIDIKDDRPYRGEAVIHRFSASLRGAVGTGSGGAS